jgi:hypothetical protein
MLDKDHPLTGDGINQACALNARWRLAQSQSKTKFATDKSNRASMCSELIDFTKIADEDFLAEGYEEIDDGRYECRQRSSQYSCMRCHYPVYCRQFCRRTLLSRKPREVSADYQSLKSSSVAFGPALCTDGTDCTLHNSCTHTSRTIVFAATEGPTTKQAGATKAWASCTTASSNGTRTSPLLANRVPLPTRGQGRPVQTYHLRPREQTAAKVSTAYGHVAFTAVVLSCELDSPTPLCE